RDLDSIKLGFMGVSWGSRLYPILITADERPRASVAILGGLAAGERPEVLAFNYVTHVKTPTLMLNGKYDPNFPYETSAKPMFDLLGTPAADKRHVVYDTDHFVPINELIKETLSWFDKYLGPVK